MRRDCSRACTTLALLALALGCGDSSGPADTTIVLEIDPLPETTNRSALLISGTTDPGATVRVTGPVDTTSVTATGGGSFFASLDLDLNAPNDITVRARDQAGNQRTAAVTVLHDDVAPEIGFAEPLLMDTTESQSGFAISVGLSDEASGIDVQSLRIENDRAIGGVFRSDGTLTTVIDAGTDIAQLFEDLGGPTASLVVPDSAIFPAGDNRLSARVADLAGNLSTTATRRFVVAADPDNLVLVDASGTAGSTENPVLVGLANAFAAGGVQFDVIFDINVFASLDSVTVIDRAAGFDRPPFNEIAPGQVRVLVFDSGGGVIPAGQGPIATLWLTIDANAPSASHSLILDGIVVSDESGSTQAVSAVMGTFVVP